MIGITTVFTLLAVVYALLATEWYRANTLLAPVEDQPMSEFRGQLSGLAAIAGIGVGTSNGSSTEALAVLRSREFSRNFILQRNLLPVLLEEQDESGEKLDIRDAVKVFREDVLQVTQDRETGLVTLTVEWKDPETAAKWANSLVSQLNSQMRDRASREAEANIKFLRSEMASNSIVALEQSISRLVEGEMQKLMLARGNDEYSFRVIDRAEIPKKRSRPRRSVLVVSTAFVSGVFALLVVFVLSAFRQEASIQ